MIGVNPLAITTQVVSKMSHMDKDTSKEMWLMTISPYHPAKQQWQRTSTLFWLTKPKTLAA